MDISECPELLVLLQLYTHIMLLIFLLIICVIDYFGKLNWSWGHESSLPAYLFVLLPSVYLYVCLSVYVVGCAWLWVTVRIYLLLCVKTKRKKKDSMRLSLCAQFVCVFVIWGEFTWVLLLHKPAVRVPEAERVSSHAHKHLFLVSKNNSKSGAACWIKV